MPNIAAVVGRTYVCHHESIRAPPGVDFEGAAFILRLNTHSYVVMFILCFPMQTQMASGSANDRRRGRVVSPWCCPD